MPIELHKACRERLVSAIAEGLPNIRVTHGMFLDQLSSIIALYKADEVIPEHGTLRKNLTEYLDEHPIIEFVSEMLSIQLIEMDRYRADAPTISLTDIDGFGNANETAERSVTQLETLPWEYTLSIDLPKAVSEVWLKFVTEFNLSGSIKLTRPSDQTNTEYPLKSANEVRHRRINWRNGLLIGAIGDPPWNNEALSVGLAARCQP
jgi:hypothetical protein